MGVPHVLGGEIRLRIARRRKSGKDTIVEYDIRRQDPEEGDATKQKKAGVHRNRCARGGELQWKEAVMRRKRRDRREAGVRRNRRASKKSRWTEVRRHRFVGQFEVTSEKLGEQRRRCAHGAGKDSSARR